MTDYFKSPIFVLGLPRSGTSMIAGALDICGAWTGTTVPGDKASNPRGFFEHVVIRERIIKGLLAHVGCDPLGVRKLPPVDLPGEVNGLADMVKAILDNDGYKHDRQWLYKDAKLTLLWPVFSKAFPEAKWLIVKRDEESFINSCLRTHFMKQHSVDRAYWKKFAEQYNIRIEALKNSAMNTLEVSSPEVIAGDFSGLEAVVSQLGLNYREQELKSFISPAFWHGEANKNIDRDVSKQ